MRKITILLIIIAALVIAFPLRTFADWINLSGAQSAPNIAEIHINDDHVRLVLEVYVKDLDTFSDLLPEDWLRKVIKSPPTVETRLVRFSKEVFQIREENGQPLSAQLKLTEPRKRAERANPFAGMLNPITRRPIPGPPEDKRVLYAELIYPFEKRPQRLTIIPPLNKAGQPQVSIGFIVYHRGVPVIDFSYLSEAILLNLDWEDPWYSRFEKKQLKRWQQAGLRTFLYVEPFEVRHETLVRVKDLAAWMGLDLRGSDHVEIDEFNQLRQRAGEFLLNHSKVLIDEQQLRPILDRTNFVKTTLTRTYFIDTPERLPLDTAMLGVVITYLTKEIPQTVTVDWKLFSKRIQKVPTVAEDPAGPFPSYVTPDDPVLVWKNYLKTYQPPTVVQIDVDKQLSEIKLPAASIVCLIFFLVLGFQFLNRKKRQAPFKYHLIGMVALIVLGGLLFPIGNVSVQRPAALAAQVEEDQAVAILESLLKNVYRSFDFREESDIYDRLATSVHGDLLQTIYLQNRKSLVVTQAGGARARVKEVKLQAVSVTSPDNSLELKYHAKWTAAGTVGHWGHIHSRKNQYEANIIVKPVDGAWKITGLDLVEEKRIDPSQRLIK